MTRSRSSFFTINSLSPYFEVFSAESLWARFFKKNVQKMDLILFLTYSIDRIPRQGRTPKGHVPKVNTFWYRCVPDSDYQMDILHYMIVNDNLLYTYPILFELI
jgi:hypothetical protein